MLISSAVEDILSPLKIFKERKKSLLEISEMSARVKIYCPNPIYTTLIENGYRYKAYCQYIHFRNKL